MIKFSGKIFLKTLLFSGVFVLKYFNKIMSPIFFNKKIIWKNFFEKPTFLRRFC